GFAERANKVRFRELQGDKRYARRRVRQYAGWPDNEKSITKGSYLIVACQQAIPSGKGKLHAVGKADDHDQWGHHVQEHVQTEPEPSKCAECEKDGDERRTGWHDHERHAAEEHDRDQASDHETERVVDQAVALNRGANLMLHHRDTG